MIRSEAQSRNDEKPCATAAIPLSAASTPIGLPLRIEKTKPAESPSVRAVSRTSTERLTHCSRFVNASP